MKMPMGYETLIGELGEGLSVVKNSVYLLHEPYTGNQEYFYG